MVNPLVFSLLGFILTTCVTGTCNLGANYQKRNVTVKNWTQSIFPGQIATPIESLADKIFVNDRKGGLSLMPLINRKFSMNSLPRRITLCRRPWRPCQSWSRQKLYRASSHGGAEGQDHGGPAGRHRRLHRTGDGVLRRKLHDPVRHGQQSDRYCGNPQSSPFCSSVVCWEVGGEVGHSNR